MPGVSCDKGEPFAQRALSIEYLRPSCTATPRGVQRECCVRREHATAGGLGRLQSHPHARHCGPSEGSQEGSIEGRRLHFYQEWPATTPSYYHRLGTPCQMERRIGNMDVTSGTQRVSSNRDCRICKGKRHQHRTHICVVGAVHPKEAGRYSRGSHNTSEAHISEVWH